MLCYIPNILYDKINGCLPTASSRKSQCGRYAGHSNHSSRSNTGQILKKKKSGEKASQASEFVPSWRSSIRAEIKQCEGNDSQLHHYAMLGCFWHPSFAIIHCCTLVALNNDIHEYQSSTIAFLIYPISRMSINKHITSKFWKIGQQLRIFSFAAE